VWNIHDRIDAVLRVNVACVTSAKTSPKTRLVGGNSHQTPSMQTLGNSAPHVTPGLFNFNLDC
jgi:hypothetical protein